MDKSVSPVDLSCFDLEQLLRLKERVQRQLDLREFEEGVKNALRQHQTRDPKVIRT